MIICKGGLFLYLSIWGLSFLVLFSYLLSFRYDLDVCPELFVAHARQFRQVVVELVVGD